MNSSEIQIPEHYLQIDERYHSQVGAVTVESREDYQVGESFIKAINNEIKERKAYFKPMKDRAKQVHKDWVQAEKASVKGLEEALATIKAKMQEWLREQERMAKERERELSEKSDVPVAVSAPSVGSKRMYYVYEIKDFSLVPDEYKKADEKKLNAFARETKGEGKIPGVEIRAENRVVVGR